MQPLRIPGLPRVRVAEVREKKRKKNHRGSGKSGRFCCGDQIHRPAGRRMVLGSAECPLDLETVITSWYWEVELGNEVMG